MTFSSSPFAGLHSNISDVIYAHGRHKADLPAFIEEGQTVSWKEFNELINQVAHHVLSVCRGSQQTVGILANNSIWAYAAFFGVLRAGHVPAPFSTMLNHETLAHLANNAGVSLVYVGKGLEHLARAAQEGFADIPVVFEAENPEIFSVYPSEMPYAKGSVMDPYSIIYSSGTTGVPKGIIHSQLARLWFAYELGIGFGVKDTSKVVVSTPLYSNGTNLCLLPAIYRGGCNILMSSFDIDAFFDVVEQHKPTHAFMVPTQFQAIVGYAAKRQIDWSSFETFVTAGTPMSSVLRRQVIDFFGPRLAELWGLTEGIGTIITCDEMLDHFGSVGRATFGSDIRLVDTDGNEITTGIGEIVGRSMMVMSGYLDNPSADEDVQWTDPNGVTYLRTGDLGEFDDQGYLWIRGRLKDMIISGGFNVYPVDIEETLKKHPSISDVSIFGVPDEKWGETPVGYYRPIEGGMHTPQEILQWANQNLSKTQRIHKLLPMNSDFPRNGLGKVIKDELKVKYSAEIGVSESVN